MPKGMQRSNREAKKAKQSKKVVAPATPRRDAPVRSVFAPPGKKA